MIIDEVDIPDLEELTGSRANGLVAASSDDEASPLHIGDAPSKTPAQRERKHPYLLDGHGTDMLAGHLDGENAQPPLSSPVASDYDDTNSLFGSVTEETTAVDDEAVQEDSHATREGTPEQQLLSGVSSEKAASKDVDIPCINGLNAATDHDEAVTSPVAAKQRPVNGTDDMAASASDVKSLDAADGQAVTEKAQLTQAQKEPDTADATSSIHHTLHGQALEIRKHMYTLQVPTILLINTELIRGCIMLRDAHQKHTPTLEFTMGEEYIELLHRLNSNLGYLAALTGSSPSVSNALPVPIADAPAFASDALQSLYKQMRMHFMKIKSSAALSKAAAGTLPAASPQKADSPLNGNAAPTLGRAGSQETAPAAQTAADSEGVAPDHPPRSARVSGKRDRLDVQLEQDDQPTSKRIRTSVAPVETPASISEVDNSQRPGPPGTLPVRTFTPPAQGVSTDVFLPPQPPQSGSKLKKSPKKAKQVEQSSNKRANTRQNSMTDHTSSELGIAQSPLTAPSPGLQTVTNQQGQAGGLPSTNMSRAISNTSIMPPYIQQQLQVNRGQYQQDQYPQIQAAVAEQSISQNGMQSANTDIAPSIVANRSQPGSQSNGTQQPTLPSQPSPSVALRNDIARLPGMPAPLARNMPPGLLQRSNAASLDGLVAEMTKLQNMLNSARKARANDDLYHRLTPDAQRNLDVGIRDQEAQLEQMRRVYEMHTGNQRPQGQVGSSLPATPMAQQQLPMRANSFSAQPERAAQASQNTSPAVNQAAYTMEGAPSWTPPTGVSGSAVATSEMSPYGDRSHGQSRQLPSQLPTPEVPGTPVPTSYAYQQATPRGTHASSPFSGGAQYSNVPHPTRPPSSLRNVTHSSQFDGTDSSHALPRGMMVHNRLPSVPALENAAAQGAAFTASNAPAPVLQEGYRAGNTAGQPPQEVSSMAQQQQMAMQQQIAIQQQQAAAMHVRGSAVKSSPQSNGAQSPAYGAVYQLQQAHQSPMAPAAAPQGPVSQSPQHLQQMQQLQQQHLQQTYPNLAYQQYLTQQRNLMQQQQQQQQAVASVGSPQANGGGQSLAADDAQAMQLQLQQQARMRTIQMQAQYQQQQQQPGPGVTIAGQPPVAGSPNVGGASPVVDNAASAQQYARQQQNLQQQQQMQTQQQQQQRQLQAQAQAQAEAQAQAQTPQTQTRTPVQQQSQQSQHAQPSQSAPSQQQASSTNPPASPQKSQQPAISSTTADLQRFIAEASAQGMSPQQIQMMYAQQQVAAMQAQRQQEQAAQQARAEAQAAQAQAAQQAAHAQAQVQAQAQLQQQQQQQQLQQQQQMQQQQLLLQRQQQQYAMAQHSGAQSPSPFAAADMSSHQLSAQMQQDSQQNRIFPYGQMSPQAVAYYQQQQQQAQQQQLNMQQHNAMQGQQQRFSVSGPGGLANGHMMAQQPAQVQQQPQYAYQQGPSAAPFDFDAYINQ